MLPLWHSPIYTEGLDPRANFPRDRYALVRSGLELTSPAEGPIAFRSAPPLADPDVLRMVHDDGYIDRFLQRRLNPKESRRIGLHPWTDQIVTRTLILTNGTVEAMRAALESGPIAGNLGGGTHHAYRDFGSGYCFINDLALAARLAQREFGIRRILVLDLDVHQGDGTAAIFEGDPSVRTVSFHCAENFPFRKMRSDLDVPFRRGTGDAVFLATLADFLRSESRRIAPDLVLYQAGVDGLASDRLGHLELSPEALRLRDEMVFRWARQQGSPLVVTMGGGYGVPIETSVASHVSLFREAARHCL